jgi:hypothetical protein
MFTCDVITTLDELRGLATDWDSLAGTSEFVDLFATSAFTRAWWRAFGDGHALRVLVFRDTAAKVRLIAPFYSVHDSESGTLSEIFAPTTTVSFTQPETWKAYPPFPGGSVLMMIGR